MATGNGQREISAIERELERVRQQAVREQAALSALDDQRREREGRIAVAQRAQQDLERRLQEKRTEAAHAEAEAALRAFKETLAARDAAAESFTSAASLLISRLEEFDGLQQSARNEWQALVSGRTTPALLANLPDADPTAEPEDLSKALARLTELLVERSDQELERDLIEKAARSPLGNDIANLPRHLQDLARARFFALARERRGA
jgi:chromosome segregation ATPase